MSYGNELISSRYHLLKSQKACNLTKISHLRTGKIFKYKNKTYSVEEFRQQKKYM